MRARHACYARGVARRLGGLAFIVVTLVAALAVAQGTGGSFGGGSWDSGGGSSGGGGGGDDDGMIGMAFFAIRILLVTVGPIPTLIIVSIAAVIFFAVRAGKGLASSTFQGGVTAAPGPRSAEWGRVDVTALRIVVAEHARAQVEAQLIEIARTANPRKKEGLAAILHRAASTLLGASSVWTHAGVTNFHPMSPPEARERFAALSASTRAGVGPTQGGGQGVLLAILVVAAKRELLDLHAGDGAQLRAALEALAALPASDLVALEIAWWPESPDKSITIAELLARQPDLHPLMRPCAHCQAPTPAGARHCPACGAPAG